MTARKAETTTLLPHARIRERLVAHGYAPAPDQQWHQLCISFGDAAVQDAQLLAFPLADPSIAPYSDSRIDYMVHSGLVNAVTLSDAIDRYARRPVRRLLDFGCGTGRILRFFMTFRPDLDYIGCEVNPNAVEFLEENAPTGSFMRSSPNPPLDLPDHACDVVYAWSIFTHLSESVHLQWIRELHRIVRPGGLVLATIHDAEMMQRITPEQPKLFTRIERGGFTRETMLEQYANRGYVFLPVEPTAAEYGIDPEGFGSTYISHEYVRRTWPHVVGILPAVPGMQDLVVMRRPGAGFLPRVRGTLSQIARRFAPRQ